MVNSSSRVTVSKRPATISRPVEPPALDRQDRELMFAHSTVPWRPNIAVVLQTVAADIERWWHNERLRQARREARKAGAKPASQGSFKQLCFLPNHVRGAFRESDVLERAIKGNFAGRKGSLPIDTRRMYEDIELLQRAAAFARRYNR